MPEQLRTVRFWMVTGIIMIGLYVYYLGYHIHTIDPKVDRTAFIAAIWKHVGYATLLFVPLAIYFILDKRQRTRRNLLSWEIWSIRLFKITFALKMITGPLAVWTRGSTWKVFDWFGIPSPMERMDGPHEFMEQFHALLNYPLIASFFLTVMVTVKHLQSSIT